MPFDIEISETESQRKYKEELNDLEAQGEEFLNEEADTLDNIKEIDENNLKEEDKQIELELK